MSFGNKNFKGEFLAESDVVLVSFWLGFWWRNSLNEQDYSTSHIVHICRLVLEFLCATVSTFDISCPFSQWILVRFFHVIVMICHIFWIIISECFVDFREDSSILFCSAPFSVIVVHLIMCFDLSLLFFSPRIQYLLIFPSTIFGSPIS